MSSGRPAVRRVASKPTTHLYQRFARNEEGVVAVIFALTLPVLIGALALGVELGLRQMEQRKLQHAADAAAISGAISRIERNYAESDNRVLASTFHLAEEGGFSPSDDRENRLLRPYSSNPDSYELRYRDTDSAVEIILRTERPGLFSAIWPGDGVSISARAVAGLGELGELGACVLGRNDVDIGGNVSVFLESCILASNGHFDIDGAATDLQTKCTGPSRPTRDNECKEWLEYTEPFGGPDIEVPCNFDGNDRDEAEGKYDETDFSGEIESGIYCLRNDVNLRGNDSITIRPPDDPDREASVTVFLGPGVTLDSRGNAALNIHAPTSGDLSGILIYGLADSEIDLGGTADLEFGCGGITADRLSLRGTPKLEGKCARDDNGDAGSGPGFGITLLE